MNKQPQSGFIPLIVLLIALLSIGGGIAAYQAHKRNEAVAPQDVVPLEGGNSAEQEQIRDTTSVQTNTAVLPIQVQQPVKQSTTSSPVVRNRRGDDENEGGEGEGDDEGGGRTTTTPIVTTGGPTTPYTLATVRAHNTSSSCWTVVYGNVYDVTSWISQHPGGAQAILSMCGVDGTAAFDSQHGGQSRATAELGSFQIGVVQ